MPAYRVSTCLINKPGDLEADWLDLQARVDCSYFQSWSWIGAWLGLIAAELQPRAVRVFSGDNLVGIAIFIPGKFRRRYLVSTRAIFLNEYPFDIYNMSIEYNGVLSDPGHRDAVYRAMVCHLFEDDPALDEVFLGAVDTEALPPGRLAGLACTHERLVTDTLEESHTWAVDLHLLVPGVDGFLQSLSKNRRGQIRRSIRLYEARGPLQIEAATDPDQALEFLDGLKTLHTLRWKREHKQGAFGNSAWEEFHRDLVETRFEAGEIQLLRVRNGESVIGYLYNLLWRGQVHVLQTGFAAVDEKGLMPGYVVHAMAIEYNRELGMRLYDLMHGSDLYKKILCSRHRKLVWCVLQRRRWRFMAERRLLSVKRKLVPAR